MYPQYLFTRNMHAPNKVRATLGAGGYVVTNGTYAELFTASVESLRSWGERETFVVYQLQSEDMQLLCGILKFQSAAESLCETLLMRPHERKEFLGLLNLNDASARAQLPRVDNLYSACMIVSCSKAIELAELVGDP